MFRPTRSLAPPARRCAAPDPLPYRLAFHPGVRRDLLAIVRLVSEYGGREAAERRVAEIEAAVLALAETPHKGSLRHEIAPGLRAIPAGRRAVIAFTVDDATRSVLVHAIAYGGSDWIAAVRRRR